MRTQYRQLTADERNRIQTGLNEGLSRREIARRVKRWPIAVSREMARNRAVARPIRHGIQAPIEPASGPEAHIRRTDPQHLGNRPILTPSPLANRTTRARPATRRGVLCRWINCSDRVAEPRRYSPFFLLYAGVRELFPVALRELTSSTQLAAYSMTCSNVPRCNPVIWERPLEST
jgi:hypothetical protein